MNYLDFRQRFEKNILISKSEILLQFPKFDNKNLTYWQKKGYIKKIIKNFYYFSEEKFENYKLFFIANNIYFPNYISSYSALSYYNIIPEFVSQIIAISTNSTKNYKTEIGNFTFHTIKKELFWGYEVKKIGKNEFYIADLEKTILDFFYFNPRYKTKEDIEGLRFNLDLLQEKLNTKKLQKYLKIFNNNTLNKKIFILLQLLENA